MHGHGASETVTARQPLDRSGGSSALIQRRNLDRWTELAVSGALAWTSNNN